MNNDFLPINEDRTGTANNQLLMVPFVDNGIFDQAKTSIRYLVRDVNQFRKFTPDDEDFRE